MPCSSGTIFSCHRTSLCPGQVPTNGGEVPLSPCICCWAREESMSGEARKRASELPYVLPSSWSAVETRQPRGLYNFTRKLEPKAGQGCLFYLKRRGHCSRLCRHTTHHSACLEDGEQEVGQVLRPQSPPPVFTSSSKAASPRWPSQGVLNES